MTTDQWNILLNVIGWNGFGPPPVGFVIDSPWLPGWAGVSTLDYFGSDRVWLDANLKAVESFPDVLFLPGFWAEFGMCTEPSAFGSRCSWNSDSPPDAHRVFRNAAEAASCARPSPKRDGLAPFVLGRLKRCRSAIEKAGHHIRFAVARGPLNIASFLLGTTELLTAVRTDPELVRRFLDTVTDFIVDWIGLQAETFDSVDGVFILDDIIGFLGKDDFEAAALPYLSRIFGSLDASVKFLHNDAAGMVCAPYLDSMGVNLFNFSSDHGLMEMRRAAGRNVALLGGIPARDVMAAGSPQIVGENVRRAMDSAAGEAGIIMSCGGGMPPGVPSANIEAFLSAAD